MKLKDYRDKQNFDAPKEPQTEGVIEPTKQLHFVVQKHTSDQPYYDLKLELKGIVKSWALPKGPSLNPEDRRLAIMRKDYLPQPGKFEDVISYDTPKTDLLTLWDKGTYEARQDTTIEQQQDLLLQDLEEGHFTFSLKGRKLKGGFALIRLKRDDNNTWLFIKKPDRYTSSQGLT